MGTKNTFQKWLGTFIEEKGVNLDQSVDVEVNGEFHIMTAGAVVEHMMVTVGSEQAKIKDILVMIDFKNGDVMHFIQHCAKGLALQHGKVA